MSDPNGLLYMQNRYYNPYLCRFINADPSGFSGGLNWYAYANGNPVSYLDPFGLGAAGEGSFSSWLDNNTYDFSPAGQFMSAYQQTQSQMQQFQSFQPDSPNGGGLSSFLNGTPFLGGAKMTAEQVFTGHDLITGESVNGLSWLSVAAIGASFIPLPLEAGAEEVAAEEGFGAGTTFTHFTDAKGIEGITGVPASSIASGDALTVGKLKFGMGSNPFMASAPGDMFMTDLSATASAGELNGIGVFGAKQSYAIQFSQETALANGVRPLLQKPGIFTIPGGTTMQGTFRIIGR